MGESKKRVRKESYQSSKIGECRSMKAIVVYEAGGPEKLVYTDIAMPSVKEGWSLVKVKAFGLNRSEIFTRKGLSPFVKFPRVLGIECVGEIAESKVFAVGEKIVSIMGEMGRAYDGSYAEYVLLPNTQIYPIQSDRPWEELAAIPETYYTAYGSFKNLQISQNDRLLVRAAGSATGLAFLRLLKAKFPEISVFGSTQNKLKQEELRRQGFTDVFLDIDNTLQSSEKFNKILELIGPASIKDSLIHLHENGILCSTGQLGGKWYLEDFDPIMELQNNVYLTTFYSGNVNAEKIKEMLAFLERYKVPVKPAKIFSLQELAEAHRYIENGKNSGKVVCVVESNL